MKRIQSILLIMVLILQGSTFGVWGANDSEAGTRSIQAKIAKCETGASEIANVPFASASPVQPSEPGASQDPSNPINPSTPEDPDQPGTPDQPGNPDVPDNPENSENPENPDQPGTPDTPNKPDKPNRPKPPLRPHKVKANGTADSLIEYARQYVGLKGLKAVKKRMKYHGYKIWYSSFYSEWCAWFVSNCGQSTGSASRIGTSIFVNDLAYQTVNSKGAKITFVNKKFYNAKKYFFKASRRKLNTEYKPRKGDIIIFSKDGKFWWTHTGIVSEDHDRPLVKVPTIEGNTLNNKFTKSLVAERVRTSKKGFRIVAYITPKYKVKKVKN